MAHPPRERLIAFGLGRLGDDGTDAVERHLRQCEDCCETLLDLADDTFVGLVKASARVASNPGGGQDRASDHDSAASTDATLLEPASSLPTAELPTAELPVELQGHPRYRIMEEIGRGGMGIVYRAEHLLMGRPVAIKLIHPRLVSHPQTVERFRREVKAAAKLSHSNIVAAFDAEQAGNVHFLVMEYVPGTDLASTVRRHGPLGVSAACECVRQTAMGLQHAHEKGMVHRDIKPHNLIFTPAGQIRILDFGLAGLVEEEALSTAGATPDELDFPPAAGPLTRLGAVMGTPDYIAPEQLIDSHSADIRADIYSLGCTLYFLLTGRPPFPGESSLQRLKARLDTTPPALHQVRREVPRALSAVALRMLARDPAVRFQTPGDVAAALAPFAAPARRPILWRGLVATAGLMLAGTVWITRSSLVKNEVARVAPHPAERGAEKPLRSPAAPRTDTAPVELLRETGRLAGHTEPILALAFSADGERL